MYLKFKKYIIEQSDNFAEDYINISEFNTESIATEFVKSLYPDKDVIIDYIDDGEIIFKTNDNVYRCIGIK